VIRDIIRKILASSIGGATACAVNGPRPIRATAAYALDCVDDRRRIKTVRGSFTIRTGNQVERWRADTLFDKEPETIRWLDRTIGADSVFYDVGANIGLYTLYACHLEPGVRAVCFEPEALNFARLNLNLCDNRLSDRVLAFSLALSDASGLATFDLSKFHAGAALHGSHNVTPEAAAHRQGVVLRPLDDIQETSGLVAPPTHLKIDVDGPEIAVLAGAKGTLAIASLRHVLIETPAEGLPEITAQLGCAGFVLTDQGVAQDGVATNYIFEKKVT
jgi:FkbM family methyltransferase